MIVGIGIDLVNKERMERVIRRWGDRFLRRILTPREYRLCKKKPDFVGSVAVRFAAKEAAFKAVGSGWTGDVGWQDVEVQSESSGKPVLFLYNHAKTLLEGCRLHLTLSHSEKESVAFVVIEKIET
jgi:holo-[acyl-carrier protein] synthase